MIASVILPARARTSIPATMITTAAFTHVAKFQFRAKGMEGHSYVEFPHPISNLDPQEMREVSLRFVDDIARQLTS